MQWPLGVCTQVVSETACVLGVAAQAVQFHCTETDLDPSEKSVPRTASQAKVLLQTNPAVVSWANVFV